MIRWNKVTWYSWTLAGIIFLGVIPFLTWYFVGQYREIFKEIANPTQEGVVCHDFSKYFVITKARDGEVGEDILVKQKSTNKQTFACQYVPDKNVFHFFNEASYFVTIKNDLMLIDTGTAPSPRELSIVDLKTRKNIYSDSYDGETAIKTYDDAISYWSPLDLKEAPITKESCPKAFLPGAENWSYTIERYFKLDLPTIQKIDLGQVRCAQTQ